MKKRLLISSVLMSAVLACALGTGTYAWYEATSAASVAATKVDLSANGVSNLGATNISLTPVVSGYDATNVVMVDPTGQERAWVNDTLVPIDTDNEHKVKFYTITIEDFNVSGSPSASELAAAAGTYTVTVGTDNERFILRHEQPSGNSGWHTKSTGANVQFDISIDAEGEVSMPQNSPIYYVVVNGSDGIDASAETLGSVSGKITFTIAAKQAQ